MCDPRALFVVGALVVVGVVLAVVLTEHHGDGGGGPPPQYTGAPAVLLESFSWKPLLSPPSQPLLFWAIDGATAAYDPGSSQCWTLADGGSRWTLVPATGQQPQLGDSLYTNSVGSTGGVYVVASSGAVWLTLDCQEWSKVARGVPLTSPRAAAKLFSLPDPYTAAPLTLVYAGGRTAGACDAKAFASDNGEHWTTFKLPELPRGCLPAFSTSGGDGTVLYFGASSVWEASGALAGGHVAWTRSCYLSGTVNEVVFGPLILPTHLFPSPTDSGINASLLNATLGSSSTDAWVSVFTVDDGIAQPSTAYSYSTDSCAWSTPRSNPPWTAKYGGGTARAVSVGAGRYALCGGYAASGRSKQLPECWLSTPVYVEHTDDPSIPTVTHRPTQSHSSTSSSTPTPSNTPTPTDSITPSNSQSSTPSITPSPSNSPTLPPSPSPTPSNTPSPSNSPTLPPSPSPTPSHSPTRSDSPTPRPPPPPAPSRASAAAAGPIAGAVCGSALAALAGALLYRRCRGRQEAVGAFYSGHGSGSGGARLNESLLGEVFGGEAGGLAMPRPTAPPQQPRSNAAAAHGTFEASAFSPPLPLHLPSARTPQPYAQPSVFECPVDLNDFVDPVTAPCGHTLCRGCYIGLFAHGCSACPTCRSPLPRQPPAINIIIRDAQAAAAQRRTTPTLAHIDEANLIVDETPAGLLGEGGFGVVRRGLWNNAPVAVKSLKRDAADAGEAPARAFNREMQVLAQLKHPNVVPVFGICHHADGRLSLVEELEVGGTLHSRLRSGGGAAVTMSTREAVRVGLDVARALSFAHAAGVTHNDVKSDNILFKNEGNTAVLADFGLARRVRSALRSTFDARLSSTGGGAGLLGTYTYCAPENMDEQSAGYGQPPGDVFSLGVLLYEMSSGLVPWEGTSMVRVLDSVRAGVRPEFFFDVDSRLRALVERCWAQEAQARPTAQEVVVALAALEAEVG